MNRSESGIIVLKFGGTSVSTRENWDRIASVAEGRLGEGKRVCIVHSALKGISNRLQQILELSSDDEMSALAEEVKQQHIELGKDLGLDAESLLKEAFAELDHLVKGIALIGEAGNRVQARLLALGELMATRLGAEYLTKQGLDVTLMDARDYLKSISQKNASEKARILSAVCSDRRDENLEGKLFGDSDLVLTQGFIASDEDGKTVLLGRGGSDVSASYFAAQLGAERLEIWTDVPGMFSANPLSVPSARLLRHLSYEEAQEIATNGAKVLHPRCIMPARKHQIPIHIKCTEKPELEGTVISSVTSDEEALVKAIAVRSGITLISMESLGMWQQVGFLSDAFEVFKRHGLSIDLVSTSESNVTVSLDPGLNMHFREIRDQFVEELEEHCNVRVIESLSAVSLLGRHIRTILHQLGPAFEVFQEQQVYLVSQAANDLNFTFVVSSDQAGRLVRQLHEQVISHSGNNRSFGPTWTEIMQPGEDREPFEDAWWKQKKDQLISIGQDKGPVYVYDRDELKRNAHHFQGLEAVNRIFYAVKANANKEVLALFEQLGLGFECVSIGELKLIFELFPEIDPERILFTPNFAPRIEYEQAYEKGVHVTLDNMYPLQQWPEIFRGKELFLRIDPGHGHGHHEHVRTGGIHSKFGIPGFELEEARNILENLDATVVGLHAHLGSGIKDPYAWKSTGLLLHEIAREFGTVRYLDLGGGFGIRENETQPSLDLKEVDKSLKQFREAHPEYELWLEPGRYLVATAGVLLARITQMKGKGNVHYVGLDTGMNSFIRPALYGARHTIVNLSKIDLPATRVVNVVGPICESGDKLGIDRLFPESEEGDVVLIANAGAYGRVMSSSYNLRLPAGEEVV